MRELDKNLLTEDGQFACPHCRGTKIMNFNCGKTRETDPWNSPCPSCNGTGYLFEYWKENFESEKRWHEETRKEFRELEKWIEKTSKCKTCKGNSANTRGGRKCPECTLEGTMPWGG